MSPTVAATLLLHAMKRRLLHPASRPLRLKSLLWVALPLSITCLYYYHLSLGQPVAPPENWFRDLAFTHNVSTTTYLSALLANNSIGPNIDYASLTLRPVRSAHTRLPLTTMYSTIIPSFATVNLSDPLASLPDGPSIQVPITDSLLPDTINATPLLFGCSTTYERFLSDDGPLKQWPSWLTNGHRSSNGAGLLLTLHKTSPSEIEHAQTILSSLGIDATVLHSQPELDMGGRWIDLARQLSEKAEEDEGRGKKREYVALIDDDTFFPALGTLLGLLQAQYHPSIPYYIGALSERVDWVLGHHAAMAYGGAGVFLTLPLAQEIARLPCLETETVSSGLKRKKVYKLVATPEGDELLYHCLRTYTEIVLSPAPLHQTDMGGDLSGFYESGEQPLSLHHFKSWHQLSPENLILPTFICGEDCVIQRFAFITPNCDDSSDRHLHPASNLKQTKTNDEATNCGAWILSNGYSLAHYPHGITFDTNRMEGTFYSESEGGDDVTMAYTIGPFRKGLSGSGRKRSWTLLGGRKEAGLRTDEPSAEPGTGRNAVNPERRNASGEKGEAWRGDSSWNGTREEVTMMYVKRRDDDRWYGPGEARDARDSVVVVVWKN